MKLFYISPSTIPSRSANSIHVVRQCEAFSKLGHQVTLFLFRSVPSRKDIRQEIEAYYGAKLTNVTIVSYYSKFQRAINLRIALLALRQYLFQSLRGDSPDLIVSRNLYGAYLLAFFARKKLVFETHLLEYGFRKRLQCSIMKKLRLGTIVISKALESLIEEHHETRYSNIRVLHDAAPSGMEPLLNGEKDQARDVWAKQQQLEKYSLIAGYFGHLYRGRGIDVVQELTARHSDIAFLVYGGNEAQIAELKKLEIDNMYVMGYLKPTDVYETMTLMDVLLMPYQRVVSIGASQVPGNDTARWMSPMKMFEYMSSGVPIISSRLPVLGEVLRDGSNCLMAEADDVDDWSRCLDRLHKDAGLAQQLANVAYTEYEQTYNWDARAVQMLRGVV